MTISLLTPRSSLKITRRWVNFSLAAAIGLLTPALAHADVSVSVDKGQESSQHKVSGAGAPDSSNGGGGGGKSHGGYGGGGSKSTTDETTGSVFYTVTVRNLANAAAKGVTLEYHIFNKTSNTATGQPTTISVDDLTATSTFDLDPNAKKDIETTDIPKKSTHTVTPGSTDKKSGKVTPGTQSSTSTSVMGWVVYIKHNDKLVHTYMSTDTILEEVAKINKGSSGGGASSF